MLGSDNEATSDRVESFGRECSTVLVTRGQAQAVGMCDAIRVRVHLVAVEEKIAFVREREVVLAGEAKGALGRTI